MIAGRGILAPQHDIAKQTRIGHLQSAPFIAPGQLSGQLSGQRQRPLHVESPGDIGARRDGRAQACRGIDRAIGAHADRVSGNIGAGAAARIDEAHRPQRIERGAIMSNAARLRRHFAPGQAQPGEILAEFVGKLGAAACAVDIFDSQEKFAVSTPRAIMRDDRRIGMAQMQRPIGAGGKAGNRIGHEADIGRTAQKCKTTYKSKTTGPKGSTNPPGPAAVREDRLPNRITQIVKHLANPAKTGPLLAKTLKRAWR